MGNFSFWYLPAYFACLNLASVKFLLIASLRCCSEAYFIYFPVTAQRRPGAARIAKLYRKVSKIEAWPPPFASWASGFGLEIT